MMLTSRLSGFVPEGRDGCSRVIEPACLEYIDDYGAVFLVRQIECVGIGK